MIKAYGAGERVRQGDIYREIAFIESVTTEQGNLKIETIEYPLVMVLSQDCDLEQDYKLRSNQSESQDKLLASVLMVPMYNAEHVYKGEHLEDLGMAMNTFSKNKSPGQFLRKNQNPRYHFLEFDQDVPVADVIMDFKHFFTIGITQLYQQKNERFVCSVSELYREDVSHRFAAFLARIGLPDGEAM